MLKSHSSSFCFSFSMKFPAGYDSSGSFLIFIIMLNFLSSINLVSWSSKIETCQPSARQTGVPENFPEDMTKPDKTIREKMNLQKT